MFSGKLLIGVLVIDRPEFRGGRLTAVPVWQLTADTGFAAELRRHGCPAEVESVELSELFDRPPRLPDSPASLLRADRAIVRFRGRQQILDELRHWCCGDAPLAVALLTGQGGQGKTRLARELCLGMRGDGWITGFVSHTDRATLAAERLADSQQPVLLVADYAEAREDQVRKLVEAAEEPCRPVRLLLLARAVGQWWDRLDPALQAASVPRPVPRALPLLDDSPGGRAETYHDAIHDFAVYLAGEDGETSPWPEVARQLSVPDQRQPSGASVLQVHTSALIALLQVGPDPVSALPGDVEEDILLRHEQKYWRETAEARLDFQPETLRNAVAAASLCGSATQQEALETLKLVRGLGDQKEDRRLGVATWLHELYPPADEQYWGSLQPDRLAEHLVGGLDREFIIQLLSGISATQKIRAHRVIDRAAEHQPHLADVWSPLERIIRVHGDDSAFDADVRRELLRSESPLFALGRLLTCDVGGPAHLLHCEVPFGDGTISIVPVFTRIQYVSTAVVVNPNWQELDVFPVAGRVALDDLGDGEWLGVNLWSGKEFKLPSGTMGRSEESTAHGEVMGADASVHYGLERVIHEHGDDSAYDAEVRQELLRPGARVLALGEPAADDAAAAHLLHCEVPVGGETIAMLPVFTRVEYIASAVHMNPSWETLHILIMDARVVQGDLGEGEWLGINPWSGKEFKLPPAELPGNVAPFEEIANREELRAEPGNAAAQSAFSKALRTLGDYGARVYTDEGVTPVRLRLFAAAAAYREALRVNSGDLAAHLGLAGTLNQLGLDEEAAAAYRDALRLDPSNVAAYLGLGDALAWLDRNEEAAAAYRDALRLDPGNAAAHSSLGHALISLGRFEQAAAAYGDALRVEPDNPVTYNNLGWMELFVRGDVRAAERLLSEAVRLDPSFTTVASGNLAAAFVAKGDRTAARELLARAIAHQDPPMARNLLWQWLLGWAEGSPDATILPQILAAVDQAEPSTGGNRFKNAEIRAVALLGLGDDSAVETLRSAAPMRTSIGRFFRPMYDLLATPEPPPRLGQLLDVWRQIIAADPAAAGAWGSPDPP